MRFYTLIYVIIFLIPSTLSTWNIWKLPNLAELWKRKDDSSSTADDKMQSWKRFSDRIVVSILGYHPNCHLKGIPHSCILSVACWWSGGKGHSGCGLSSWIISCCIPPNYKEMDYYEKMIVEQKILEDETTIQEISPIKSSIQRRNSWNNECGISGERIFQKRIIGVWRSFEKFVATAAHCILPAKVSELLVYLGELDIKNTGKIIEMEPAEIHKVRKRLIHPEFRYKANQPDRFDLALLELIKDAAWNFHIKPICLPDTKISLDGKKAVVAGWGKTDPLSPEQGTNILRSVSVPILDIEKCKSWHKSKQIVVELHSDMLCAGYEAGKLDACLGDSGGPLIMLEEGRWTLVGITSAGFGCGEPHQPGIYHKITKSVNWIKQILNKQKF